MSATKVIVLTPVKNEEWIIDRFLAITSVYADHIIIIDQCSTDASPSICRKYPKVVFIDNESDEYDEASRQILLIKKAREIAPSCKRILLALDCDEILAGDFDLRPSWQKMLDAEPGTILLFNKIDIFRTPYQYLDYNTPWPLGFIDDGSEHNPKLVHSIRIPTPFHARKMVVEGVFVLHYAMVDMKRQRSKMRMYSVIEKVNGTSTFYNRRKAYGATRDWQNNLDIKSLQTNMVDRWQSMGVDLTTFNSEPDYWQDLKVLEFIHRFGAKKFYSEDIWDSEWNTLAANKIAMPSKFHLFFFRWLFELNRLCRIVAGSILGRTIHNIL